MSEEIPAIYKIHLRALLGDKSELWDLWWFGKNKALDNHSPAEYHDAGGEKEMMVARYVIGMWMR